ncbi:hypothetical protein KGF56_002713 [Candida oxycetoniae]|uniref:Smr domain-containing protein n=1 Tax=Candida oxycetoniae TaxID=497107 RepID=A0AAI9SXR9_9ASCO|nr:uncharacterized protein KGF56_002713 [Candida oxycetoniae]KAI3404521.2 hypothetical protein KGF56_002713 [Candida oxycetoniae]
MTDIIDKGVKLFDENNQRDYNHVVDPQYKQARAKADEYYKKQNALSQQSQAAYKKGDGQRAHELSEQSKQALNQAEYYSQQAAEYVFRENNADSAFDEIDLHGLYVKEAEWILQKRLRQAIATNQSHLKVIVGKGLHSSNGIAKLKPAVEQLCSESGLKHHIDPKNGGVLIIDLQNSSSSQVPSSWANSSINQPQQAYHQGNQPYYHTNQPHYQQYQGVQQHQQQQQGQSQDIKTGNQLVDLLVKAICSCISAKK